MSKSKIEWTERTWNPVTGCTKVSQGCKHCYAERIYERFNGKGTFKNVTCHEDRLNIPQRIKQPSTFFVNSMSDLFHEDVPFEFIRKVFGVMSCRADWHTYQVLTKRPKRLLEFIAWFKASGNNPEWRRFSYNIWLGVSVEDQQAANERIPLLLQVPAAVRFLSCEPLLGPVKLFGFNSATWGLFPACIDWVIVGGESGPGARPIHPNWVRSLRDQCAAAGVPFFFKQWGEFVSVSEVAGAGKHHTFPDGATVRRTGKKAAGRLLDGVEHNGYPVGTTAVKEEKTLLQ